MRCDGFSCGQRPLRVALVVVLVSSAVPLLGPAAEATATATLFYEGFESGRLEGDRWGRNEWSTTVGLACPPNGTHEGGDPRPVAGLYALYNRYQSHHELWGRLATQPIGVPPDAGSRVTLQFWVAACSDVFGELNVRAVDERGRETDLWQARVLGWTRVDLSFDVVPGENFRLDWWTKTGLALDEIRVTVPIPSGGPRSPSAAWGSNDDQITVRWLPPEKLAGVTGYKIYRSDRAASGFSHIGSTTGLEFVDGGHAEGAVFYYRVSAVEGVAEGPSSAIVRGEIPSPARVERTLANVSLAVPTPRVPTAALELEGKPAPDNPSFYVVTGRAGDTQLPSIRVFTAGAVTARIHERIDHVPSQYLEVNVSTAYRYAPSEVVPGPVCIDDKCVGILPFNPANPGFVTGASKGSNVTISLAVRAFVVDHRDRPAIVDQRNLTLTIPLAGQILGATAS